VGALAVAPCDSSQNRAVKTRRKATPRRGFVFVGPVSNRPTEHGSNPVRWGRTPVKTPLTVFCGLVTMNLFTRTGVRTFLEGFIINTTNGIPRVG
jgi:hypothetical protein